jgi:SlyX protein
MSETALERIELKVAFLERANQELGDIVYRHQKEIDMLRAQLAAYQRQLDGWKAEAHDPQPPDERPPHY